MNLFSGGTLGSFKPVTYLSRKDITVIRPMIYAAEAEVARAANRQRLPVIKSPCPLDTTGEREHVKQLIKALGKEYPALEQKIIGAMEKAELDGWGPQG